MILTSEERARLIEALAAAIADPTAIEDVAYASGLRRDLVDVTATPRANWTALFDRADEVGSAGPLVGAISRVEGAPQLALDLYMRSPEARPRAADAPPPSPLSTMRDETIHCAREDQWKDFVGALERSTDEIALLAGRADEAHEYFIERVRRSAHRAARDARVLPPIPLQFDEYEALLADTVGESTDAVDALLMSSHGRRVVVIHGTCDMSDERQLERAQLIFHAAIPRIARQLAQRRGTAKSRGVLLVQPLAWKPTLLERLHLSKEERRVRGIAAEGPTVKSLPLLSRITEGELRSAMREHLTPAELEQLVRLTSRIKTSREILDKVEDYLRTRSNEVAHGVQSISK